MPYNLPHLLLPLLGGFIFIRLWNRTRWYTVQADKERLLIYASLAGLLFFCLAFLIKTIPPFVPCVPRLPCLPTWWGDHVKFPQSSVYFLSFVLGATFWWPLNKLWPFRKWWDKEKMARRILVEEGDPLDQLFEEAMSNSKQVMLTLDSRKVYIGYVLSAAEPKSDRKSIDILPTLSGYRDKDTLALSLMTNYAAAYESVVEDIGRTQAQLDGVRAELARLRSPAAPDSPPAEGELRPGTSARQSLLRAAEVLEEELKDMEDVLDDVRVVLKIDEISAASMYAPLLYGRFISAGDGEESSPPS